MYFVKYGEEYLHDPRTDDRQLLDLKLECSENTCGYCDFTIYPEHPMYNKLIEHDNNNPIQVIEDNEILFYGFIYELGEGFYLSGTVKCKGELEYLNASIVRPYSTLENGYGDQAPSSVDGYFDWLINQHNEQVNENKRFKIGINQGAALDENNYIYRENRTYPTTFSELKEKLLDNVGGNLRIRHENGERYIDYLSEWTDTNGQILDFGKNLTDYTRTDDSDNISTFIIPLGAKMSETSYDYNDGYYVTEDTSMDPEKEYYTKSDSGYSKVGDDVTAFEKDVTYYEYFDNYDESDLNLTIAGLDDKEYVEDYRKLNDVIYCESAVKKYGWIGTTYENTDITTKEMLLYRSIISLKEVISPKRTIEIKAIDMHLINKNVKSIHIGEYVRVRSVPHNLDSYYLCRDIDFDLNNPENTLYTLGTTFDTLTGEQNKRIKQLNATINKTYEKAEELTEKEKENSDSASEALKKANEAKDAASDANEKADNANKKADDANSKADTAISDAKDASDAANDANKKADDANSNVTIIEGKVEEIKNSSDKAQQDAADAKDAANKAQTAADNANNSASNAKDAADKAQSKADEAYNAAGSVQSQVTEINGEISNIKSDASDLRDDLEGKIETVSETMTANYTKKSELTEVENNLKTEITKSAAGVKSEVSQEYATKKELAATDQTANDAKDSATAASDATEKLANTIEATYSTKSEVKQLSDKIESTVSSVEEVRIDASNAKSTAEEAKTAAANAQMEANTAKSNAKDAQTAADNAKTAADTAQAKANTAAENLATAEKNLEDLQQQADVTDEQLTAAKEEVEKAKTAVKEAQADADKANQAAKDAQTAADNAKTAADTAQSTADNAKTAADAAQADVDKLKDRVTKAETSIKQNTEAIELRATKEEVEGAVDKIKIGCRNLLLGTSDPVTYTGDGSKNQSKELYNLSDYYINELDHVNTYFTMSFEWESTATSGTFSIQSDTSPYLILSDDIELSDDVNKGSATHTVIISDSSIDLAMKKAVRIKSSNVTGNIIIKRMMFENSNKASSWQPAPEDVAQDATDKADNALDGAKTYTDSQIKITSDSIQSTVTKAVDEVTIGGTNLAKKSKAGYAITGFSNKDETVTGSDGYQIGVDSTVPGFGIMTWNVTTDKTISCGPYYYMGKVLGFTDYVEGETYTISCYMKGDNAGNINPSKLCEGYTFVSGSGEYGTEWTKVYAVFTSKKGSSTYTNFYGYQENATTDKCRVYAYGIKIERGNKPSDWSPATDDIDERYTTQTEFTQTSDEIRMDFNKSMSYVDNETQSKIKDTNDKMDSNFNTLNKYIRFVDGKIVIGQSDNELVLTIQNDKVSFTQSGTEIAYFSENNLYIKKAEVLTTLRIGNYEFAPRSNGGLALRKRGA